jgi:hypothetical protein
MNGLGSYPTERVPENLKLTALNLAMSFRYDHVDEGDFGDFAAPARQRPLGLESVMAMAKTIYRYLADEPKEVTQEEASDVPF